jgi:hypothetical protein
VSLLPEDASFAELVQECFLAHRGAGLMLSPLDVELIGQWAEAEVPFEVVARGIRKAAEKALWDARPGEPVLRTLRACRREVEVEIKKYRARSAGAGTGGVALEEHGTADGFALERHRRLRAAVAKAGREHPRLGAVTAALLEGVLAQPAGDLRELDRREELVTAVLVRAQPFEERLRLYQEATRHAGPADLATPQARKLSRRFHRHALLRRVLGLPAFW